MDASTVASRVDAVRERIDAALMRSGRTDAVTLVAVTKTHPAAAVRAVREAGVLDVGENRVGELEDKARELEGEPVRWHLIGHLQRNKVRAALPLFHLLHSLDSLRLAKRLSQEAAAANREVRALVQVNAGGEEAKGGFEPDQALDAIGEICAMDALRIEGLMTMAPFTDDEAVLRRTFQTARRVWDEARQQVPGFHPLHLSMGMSNDYEIAVEEGSTLVRVGTALFGEREP